MGSPGKRFLETRAALNPSIAIALVAELGSATTDEAVNVAASKIIAYWLKVERRGAAYEQVTMATGAVIRRRA